MERQEIENLFAKASQLDKEKRGYHSAEQWKEITMTDGAKKFKRAALGFFDFSSVKSLEEVAQLLQQTGIVASVDEGRKIVPLLDGKSVRYKSIHAVFGGNLGFTKVTDRKGEEAYRIFVYAYD